VKKSLWLQLVALSLLISILTSAIFFAVFNQIAAATMAETRKNIYVFLAHLIEDAPYTEAIQHYEKFRSGAPALGGTLWVLSARGDVLATNAATPPPPAWLAIPKPKSVHEMSFVIPPFSHFATLILVRLQAAEPTYLLVKPSAASPNKVLANIEIWLFFSGLLSATFTGLLMIVFYLRKTSAEAKQVIAALSANQLDARFSIQRFDKIANLKLDFNAMADEIEQLVQRLQKTETARKNLLQELSHDLRTPLTSLRTSVEMLTAYREQMSAVQQGEFLAVIQSELDYFVRLLEDLFFFADIAEPGYRRALDLINIDALLSTEVQARQLAQPQLRWLLEYSPSSLALVGDTLLLSRLLRNTLDNAAKYAHSQVTVSARIDQNRVEICIADDGPGISPEAIRTFGERRKHRVRQSSSPLDFSLGLGSVVIKTIVELHGAALSIQSSAIDSNFPQGTRFIFSFPQRHH